MRDKRRDQWENGTWILHHDNVPTHKALSIRQFLAERQVAVLDQPPYSPDLAPCDFFLFPKLKGVIKGTRFPDGDDRTPEDSRRSVPGMHGMLGEAYGEVC